MIAPNIEAENRFSHSTGLENPAAWLAEYLGGNKSVSGISVNGKTVLSLPAAWSPIRTISGHIGSLPLEIRKGRHGEAPGPVIPDHRVYRLLNETPGPLQTGMVFKETLQLHSLLWGNGRAWISRDGVGRPTSLLLLPPDTVTCLVDGVKYHSIFIENDYLPEELKTNRYGSEGGNYFHFPDEDVFHIPSLGWDGIQGLNIVQLFKETFGNDKSGQQTVSYSFANNGRPGLLLEAPQQVFRTAKDAKEFLDGFNAGHEGVRNAGKTGLIREGMKAHVLPTSAVDSQHLENRNFSREDIAKIFGTQMLLGSSAVYKNISERMTSYVQIALRPWFAKWEQETERKLLRRSQYTARFNAWDLLKDDPATLAVYTGQLAMQKAITQNEIRIMHGLPPMPDPAMNRIAEPQPEQIGNDPPEPDEDDVED